MKTPNRGYDHYLPLLFGLVVLGLFTYAFRHILVTGMVTYGDVPAFPSDGMKWIRMFIPAWYEEGLGRNEGMNPQYFLMGLMLLPFGNNTVLAQKLFIFLSMPLAIFTMYLFLRGLVDSRLARSVGSLVYGINPLTVMDFYDGGLGLLIVYATYPILLLFLLNMLEGKRLWRNALLFTLFLVLASTFSPQAPLLFAPAAAALFATNLLIKRDWKVSSKVVLVLLMSLAITYLTLLSVTQGQYTIGTQALDPDVGRSALLLDELKFFFKDLTLIQIFGFLGFSLPLFGFSALLLVDDRNKRVYALGLALAGLLMILFLWATHLGLTTDLFRRFSVLFAFRQPDKLLVLPLVFCILTALTMDGVQKRLKPLSVGQTVTSGWTKGLYLSSVVLLSLALIIPTFQTKPRVPWSEPWQFFRGDMGWFKRSDHGDWTAKGISPKYYEIGKWLDQRRREEGDDFRTLWLPQDGQLNDVLTAVDKHTFIAPRVSIPKGLPGIDYIKSVLETVTSGTNSNMGFVLANANVKYIILDLSSPQGGKPYVNMGSYTYYAYGDPKEFAQILERQKDLQLIVKDRDFLIYENKKASLHVGVYDRILLLPEQGQIEPNLIVNPGFDDGLSNWKQVWVSISNDRETARSGASLRIESRDSTLLTYALQAISLEPETEYEISGWMKIQNANSANFKLEFIDAGGKPIEGVYPVIINGTQDWTYISRVFRTPPGTVKANLYPYGGWSLDGVNPGITWFDSFALVKYFSKPSAQVGELLSYTPGFDPRRQLIVAENGLLSKESGVVDTYLALAANAVILLGDPSSSLVGQKTISRARALLSIYEGETSLTPTKGEWAKRKDSSFSQQYALECSGKGVATKQYLAPWSGYATVSMRQEGGVTLAIDGKIMELEERGQGGLKQYETPPIYLEQGEHELSFNCTGDSATIDQFLILLTKDKSSAFEDLFPLNPSTRFSSIKKNATEYIVSVDSKEPVLIVLGESFHPDWNARVNGEKVEHFSTLSWANGFYLDRVGKNTLRITFDQQNARNMSILIWGITWIALLLAITYALRKDIVLSYRAIKALVAGGLRKTYHHGRRGGRSG